MKTLFISCFLVHLIVTASLAKQRSFSQDEKDIAEILISAVQKLEERDGPGGFGLKFIPQEKIPFSGWHKQYWDNGRVRFLKQYKQGKKDGLYHYWSRNGMKSQEINYQKDKAHGLWTSWYANGQKQLEQTLNSGKLDGPARRWYENGKIKDECIYKDGRIISIVVWKPNGERCLLTNLVEGNGLWVRYKQDGSEDWRSNYRDGFYVLD